MKHNRDNRFVQIKLGVPPDGLRRTANNASGTTRALRFREHQNLSLKQESQRW